MNSEKIDMPLMTLKTLHYQTGNTTEEWVILLVYLFKNGILLQNDTDINLISTCFIDTQ